MPDIYLFVDSWGIEAFGELLSFSRVCIYIYILEGVEMGTVERDGYCSG